MFIAELGPPNFADYDLSTLRTGIMAGSPCPVEVMKRVVSEMGMTEVTICYGMTETSPVSTQTGADDDLDRRTSTVGRVHLHLEVKAARPGDQYRAAAGSRRVLHPYTSDARLRTSGDRGDRRGALDAHRRPRRHGLREGYLNIVGRIKDMVIRAGRTCTREIEEFLYTHPDIVDAQVIGVPDERYGEELMAWAQREAPSR